MRRLGFDLFIFSALLFSAYHMYAADVERVFFLATLADMVLWVVLKAFVYLRLGRPDS